jgi:hypothetical protein
VPKTLTRAQERWTTSACDAAEALATMRTVIAGLDADVSLEQRLAAEQLLAAAEQAYARALEVPEALAAGGSPEELRQRVAELRKATWATVLSFAKMVGLSRSHGQLQVLVQRDRGPGKGRRHRSPATRRGPPSDVPLGQPQTPAKGRVE